LGCIRLHTAVISSIGKVLLLFLFFCFTILCTQSCLLCFSLFMSLLDKCLILSAAFTESFSHLSIRNRPSRRSHHLLQEKLLLNPEWNSQNKATISNLSAASIAPKSFNLLGTHEFAWEGEEKNISFSAIWIAFGVILRTKSSETLAGSWRVQTRTYGILVIFMCDWRPERKLWY